RNDLRAEAPSVANPRAETAARNDDDMSGDPPPPGHQLNAVVVDSVEKRLDALRKHLLPTQHFDHFFAPLIVEATHQDRLAVSQQLLMAKRVLDVQIGGQRFVNAADGLHGDAVLAELPGDV